MMARATCPGSVVLADWAGAVHRNLPERRWCRADDNEVDDQGLGRVIHARFAAG